MQAIKGGCVGQTFALATSIGDSGGKKSRIRRSKEDRKAMVELFIKRYQSSNDGNFPSLNLTHKEVGGSFYTVREIVREVIQENRVLGPAKLSTEQQQNDFAFLDLSPLGSISTEPQTHRDLDSGGFHEPEYESLNGYHVGNSNPVASVKDEESETLSMPFDDGSTGHLTMGPASQNFDNEETITAAEAILQNEETSIEQLQNCRQGFPCTDQVASEKSGEIVQMKSRENGSVMTQKTTDFVVETFPLTPVAKIINALDEKSDGLHEITNTLEETFIEEDGFNSRENDSVSGNEKVQGTQEVLPVENNEGALVTPLISTDASTTNYIVIPDNSEITDFDKASLPVGAKSVNASETINGSTKQPISLETTLNKNKLNVQHDSSFKNGSGPTLNRINLETWEGSSKKHVVGTETNPLLGFFKTLVTAFVKFWTE